VKKNGVNVDAIAAARSGIDILIAPSIFGIPADVPDAREYMLIEDLAQSLGARAIVPIDERDLLDDSIRYPVALALANTTVSLPAYPSLRKDDVARIASIAKEG
jgi:hypothetical protein